MLSLTKRSEYALVAMCHLARVKPRVTSAREIAELHEVPLPLLMNVLKQLSQAGMVRSVRGAKGGYTLAGPPESLALSAVISAVEGPVALVDCAPGARRRRGCNRAAVCSIRRPVHKVHRQLVKFLDGLSIADIAFDEDYADRSAAAGRRKGRPS
jgi:Rrf2 family protein